jgi:acyl-CoA thioesterase-1
MIYNKIIIFFVFSALLFGCSGNNATKEENQTSTSQEIEVEEDRPVVLFFGNSLTAGYGLDEEDAFPALIQDKIDSAGLEYVVINGGLSGETTASGLNRLDWFLEEGPAVFVLELGGNDGLRGISVAETRKNLKEIIQKVRTRYPETRIILAGMQIPPNMGQQYTAEFSGMYQEIAEEESVNLIPFLLEGVAGDPELNLPDGIHPTETGHVIVAETVWENIFPLL